ncbi:MAG: L-threonylcarbamoyladenylate synthase [Myxococcota bacterium]|nr:L-threonylcarbamoyladenylate synthase [Myxococcota bacterium]
MILQLSPHPSPYQIERLVGFLEAGGLLGMPTDTSYSLVCLPDRKSAVQKLTALRRLDPKKPLALMFRDIRHISEYALVDDLQFRILKRHLPGPYCFILESKRSLPRFIGDKRKRFGARVPDHIVPQTLIEALRKPLIVTSAIEPDSDFLATDPWTVESFFGHGLEAVIDAGDVPGGVSSVVDLTTAPPEVFRIGLGDVSSFT